MMRHSAAMVFLLLILFAVSVTPVSAKSVIKGVVVKVTSGDSVTVWEDEKLYPIRLYGIDAPQKGQAYWQESKRFISSMVFNKDLSVTIVGRSENGRRLGLIRMDSLSINAALVENGMAWVDPAACVRAECTHWLGLQTEAKKRGTGLWRGNQPIPPWEFQNGQ